MQYLTYIVTGGFLIGYRTYISVAIVIVTALAAYGTGDVDLVHTVETVFGAAGLGALRANASANARDSAVNIEKAAASSDAKNDARAAK